jgi:hypothetical protein
VAYWRSCNVEDDAEADSPLAIHQLFMRALLPVVVVSMEPRVQRADPFLAVEWVRVIVRLYQVPSAC